MSKYTLTFHDFADLPVSAQEALVSRYGDRLGDTLDKQVRVKFSLDVEADSLGQALSKARKRVSGAARFLNSQSKGWYSIDVVESIDRQFLKSERGGPFTSEEQLNPDVILSNVPANSSQEVIRAAKRRYRRLRCLLIMREFCIANPGLSFCRPDGCTHGITRVNDWHGNYRVTPISSQWRVRVHSPNVNEVIEPNDSHRFNAIVAHEQAVRAAGAMAISELPITQANVTEEPDLGPYGPYGPFVDPNAAELLTDTPDGTA